MVEPRSEPKREPIKRQQHLSLVDIAYHALIEAIVNQQFEAGAQINIDMLGRELNMSNTPVREALMKVMGERLVKQQSNRGFVVTGVLTPLELQELFDVRHVLEIHAVNVGEITSAAVEMLEDQARQMNETKGGFVYQDFKDFLQADHLFHRTLVGLANNSLLIKSWEDLHVHLHLSRLYTGVGLFDRGESATEHLNVIIALRNHDREQAATVLSSHIRDVEKRLLAFLRST